MVAAPVRFGNKLRGSTLTNFSGVEFDFAPTIGFTAKHLFELEKSIKSFRVPLETSIREVIRPSIKENFAVGGRPKWAPLAASTMLRKGHTKVNVNTGRLSKVAAQRNIWTVGKTTAIINGGELVGRVPYALFVQAGHANRGDSKGSMVNEIGNKVTIYETLSTPARPYLMIQAEDAKKIETIFGLWIDERIARAWGR